MNLFIFLLGLIPLVSSTVSSQCIFFKSAGFQFDPSTCDVEKACFIPTNANCYMGCSGMGFSYVFTDDSYKFMKIELFGNSATQSGVYFAVGFSVDNMMASSRIIIVTLCTAGLYISLYLSKICSLFK